MSAAGERWRGQIRKFYGNAGSTHRSVGLVRCPHCKAKKGELCIGANGPKLETHYVRRHATNPRLGCPCAGCVIARKKAASRKGT